MIGDYHVAGAVMDVLIMLILIFALGLIGIYGFIIGGYLSRSACCSARCVRAQLVSYEVFAYQLSSA